MTPKRKPKRRRAREWWVVSAPKAFANYAGLSLKDARKFNRNIYDGEREIVRVREVLPTAGQRKGRK